MKGWTNKQVDSTIFMGFFLIIFGGYIYFLVTNESFRDAEITSHLLLLFSGVFGAMSQYFFSQKKTDDAPSGNGDTAK